MRLYDREVARKDMIERNAYFLATLLGILISAGLLQVKSITDAVHILNVHSPFGIQFIPTFSMLLLVCVVSFLFCIFQATRLRGWYSAMPPNINEVLFDRTFEQDSTGLIEGICSHILAAHGAAFYNNNRKSLWVHCALLSFGILLLLIIVVVAILVFYAG
jgi:hypothetical protein